MQQSMIRFEEFNLLGREKQKKSNERKLWMQQSMIFSDDFKNPFFTKVGGGKSKLFENCNKNANFNFVINTPSPGCKRNHSEIFLIFLPRSTFINFSTEILNSSITNFDFLTEFPLMHFADKKIIENTLQTYFESED